MTTQPSNEILTHAITQATEVVAERFAPLMPNGDLIVERQNAMSATVFSTHITLSTRLALADEAATSARDLQGLVSCEANAVLLQAAAYHTNQAATLREHATGTPHDLTRDQVISYLQAHADDDDFYQEVVAQMSSRPRQEQKKRSDDV